NEITSYTLSTYTTLFRSDKDGRIYVIQFTVFEALHVVIIGIDITVIGFLDTSSRWCIIARNSQTQVTTIAEHNVFLNQALSKRADRKSTRLNSSHVKISY